MTIRETKLRVNFLSIGSPPGVESEVHAVGFLINFEGGSDGGVSADFGLGVSDHIEFGLKRLDRMEEDIECRGFSQHINKIG